MAALILSQIGSNLFGTIGGFIGALAGARIDAVAGAALAPTRVMPSRLKSQSVQASQEGEPIPLVHGRARITGQVVWASRFRETSTARRVGGKTGQRVVERHYDISFAIGLCEGPIRGIGRVWANGDPLDLSALNWRLLPGGPDQMPDPLIEAIEGLDRAPAHRGLATVVFEDFPLDGFGDRIPQLSFEVFTQTAGGSEPGSLEALARGVNLIPACGEFVYATTPVRTVLRPGRERVENLNASAGRTDFRVALDTLQRDLPGVDHVSLAVAWFGDDLRCGSCQVMPRVEVRGKVNRPLAWAVAGLTRATAPLVSTVDWRPALGGTPADFCVIEALRELKLRGFKVTLHPFLLMDIPAGNSLPAPTGGTQPPYLWRGRISCHPAPGHPGSPAGTAVADAQVQAFFGAATPGQMTVGAGTVSWQAGTPWGYRRFVLHLAGLAQAAGGVDGFLLGSELCGLTRVRGAGGQFPAVEALRTLAGEVRSLLGPSTALSYGADWTEYGAQVPADDPSGLVFPLDPLWADPLIDHVGLDWYPPLADQRPGEGRPTRAALAAGMASGEAYDWYYASDADRAAGTRLPIQDGSYGEHWVWRQKDLRGWWLNAHHPRAGGVRATTPTGWQPGMKPVRLMELGFPAVDRGANRPSAFPDPKSVESVLPPFSTGARDDAAQRTALEAALAWWHVPGNNPVSPATGAPMLDPAHTHLWCWDARPYPQFPARTDLWADGPHAATGHWLAGRAGAVSLGAVLADIAGRAGVTLDVSGVEGTLEGHVLAGTTPARDALAILALAFGLEACTRPDGTPALRTAPGPVAAHLLSDAALARSGSGPATVAEHDLAAGPAAARVETWSSERAGAAASRGPGRAGQRRARHHRPGCADHRRCRAGAHDRRAPGNSRSAAARAAPDHGGTPGRPGHRAGRPAGAGRRARLAGGGGGGRACPGAHAGACAAARHRPHDRLCPRQRRATASPGSTSAAGARSARTLCRASRSTPPAGGGRRSLGWQCGRTGQWEPGRDRGGAGADGRAGHAAAGHPRGRQPARRGGGGAVVRHSWHRWRDGRRSGRSRAGAGRAVLARGSSGGDPALAAGGGVARAGGGGCTAGHCCRQRRGGAGSGPRQGRARARPRRKLDQLAGARQRCGLAGR